MPDRLRVNSRLSIAVAVATLFSASALAADKPAKPAKVAASPEKAAAKPGTLVTVNGVAVPKTLADAFVAEQKTQGVADSPELRDAVREELVRREIMAQEARRQGIDKRPDVAAQMDMARQAILIRALVQEQLRATPVTEVDQRKEYDKIKVQMSGNEYKARHILVDAEDEAKSLIDKLGAGGKFEDLAKASKDPGSKDKGGELGWSAPGAYVKPFADALVALEKGKYTTKPVKSDFGYHVILLEDTRPVEPPPFDQVKPQLQQMIQQQRVEKMIAELRARAKVE